MTDSELFKAKELLAELLDCGTMDVDCVIEMCTEHPDTVEYAKTFADDIGEGLNFGCMVDGCKNASINELDDDVQDIIDHLDYSDDMGIEEMDVITDEWENITDSFDDMIIDDNYSAWGSIAYYGNYKGEYEDHNIEIQSMFAEFVVDSKHKDKLLELISVLFNTILQELKSEYDDD